ncbi:MAG: choice-of-anchor U domain-containing protein [Usitatibacter sp.]
MNLRSPRIAGALLAVSLSLFLAVANATSLPPNTAASMLSLDGYQFLLPFPTSPGPRMQVRDNFGNPVADVRVRFQLPNCGSLSVAPYLPSGEVITRADGIADFGTYLAWPPPTNDCPVTMSLPDSPWVAPQTLHFIWVARSEVVLSPLPASSLTVDAGQQFRVGVQLSFRGFPLPGIEVRFSAPGIDGGPSPVASIVALGMTDEAGNAYSDVVAGFEGRVYPIMIGVAGISTAQVTVTQTAAVAAQHASALSPSGLGTIHASLFTTQSRCGFAQTQFFAANLLSAASAPPAHYVFPFGVASLRADNCGVGQGVDFAMDYPRPLPPTAVFWRFGPTPDNRAPHWYPMTSAVIDGSQVRFHVDDGGLGDDDLAVNGSIGVLGGVMTAGGLYQDMWWSGPAENGWGMSVVQHGEALFSVIYAYDALGNPAWYVMPTGSWNADVTVFSGALFTPRGSPFVNYDASRFVPGAPVGRASIAFNSSGSATLDYTINGVSGHKAITRQGFGVAGGANEGTRGDMWWGGSAQNGWGVALLHQYATMFMMWFTYDTAGAPTWFVMPGGAWTSAETYEGHVYRTKGSPWAGAVYDASGLKVFDVGTYRVRFTSESASFDYTIDGHSGTLALERQPF